MEKFNYREKRLLELWFLCCEDMSIEIHESGERYGCSKCEFQYECEMLRIKIFGNRNHENFIFDE